MELNLSLIGLALIGLVVAIYAVNRRTGVSRRPRGSGRSRREGRGAYVEELSCNLSPVELKLWRTLLNMSMGDARCAKGLVVLEKSRRPGAQMEALIAGAIDRWRRDLNR